MDLWPSDIHVPPQNRTEYGQPQNCVPPDTHVDAAYARPGLCTPHKGFHASWTPFLAMVLDVCDCMDGTKMDGIHPAKQVVSDGDAKMGTQQWCQKHALLQLLEEVVGTGPLKTVTIPHPPTSPLLRRMCTKKCRRSRASTSKGKVLSRWCSSTNVTPSAPQLELH